MVWQPLARRGIVAASDGYVWVSSEILYTHDVGNGAILEMYFHRSGYAPGDLVTEHSRRRFRLIPNPNFAPDKTVHINPSLWIIHWGAADQYDRMPTAQYPPPANFHRDAEIRNSLRLLSRKDFMLNDHTHWPNVVRDMPPTQTQPAIQARMPARMAYGQEMGPPRHYMGNPNGPIQQQQQQQQHHVSAPRSRARGGVITADVEIPDEELRTDFFDVITPRDVSLARYKRNHDWMEEVASSHFTMTQIVPPDLGLGRVGELAKLTDGIFETHLGLEDNKIKSRARKDRYVGKLPPGMAHEFRKRVDVHVHDTEAEMAKMKADLERFLHTTSSGSIIKKAEAVLDETPATGVALEESISKIEGLLRMSVSPLKGASRIQDGGFCESAERLAQSEPVMMEVDVNDGSLGGGQASGAAQGTITHVLNGAPGDYAATIDLGGK